MKSSKPKIQVVGIPAIAILAVLGFLFIPNMFIQKADIKLAASPASLKFTGASGNLGTCKSTNKPYCVHVKKWYRAEIIFRLIGSPDWEFSRMQLVAEPSDVESSDDESSAKLNFGKQSGFTPKMRTDFYVEVNGKKSKPDTNGIIELGGSPGVGQNFTLIDNNNLEQIYSYQLEVCDENDVCNQTDPKVENEG